MKPICQLLLLLLYVSFTHESLAQGNIAHLSKIEQAWQPSFQIGLHAEAAAWGRLAASYQTITNSVYGPVYQESDNFEFLEGADYPVKVDGEASFYSFDTTSLEKGKFVFVVSGSKTAFFKKESRIVIVTHLNRRVKQNGYTDYFEGSGYQVTLDVIRAQKVSNSRARYAGVLKFTQKDKFRSIAVHGINEEYNLNLTK